MNECWVVFLSHPQMPYYSPILPSVFFVNGALCALIAKTKKQPITRAGGDTFKSPILLPHVQVPMGGFKMKDGT
jgi:hypothetical protein